VHLQRALNLITYWLYAMGKHSLQSPFIYDLYKNVIKNKLSLPFTQYDEIRKKYKSSSQKIEVSDYGSGSLKSTSNIRKVADIASYGISKRRYSEILYRLIDYFQFEHVIELGTSLGINTLYMSHVSDASVVTFEGDQTLAEMAKKMFSTHRKNNIKVIQGDINTQLPHYLEQSKPIDLVFFDANHQYEPTIQYFEWCLARSHNKSCFVFDDIHLTKEMEKAWEYIKQHYRTIISIDLYQIGIVFINPELTKQHYVLEA